MNWPLNVRRFFIASVTGGMILSLGLMMMSMLNANHWLWWDWILLGCFVLTLPWGVLGFWNSIIGFILLRFHRRPNSVAARLERPSQKPLSARTAILFPSYDEKPEHIFQNIRFLLSSLKTKEERDLFEVFFLSDTQNSDILAQEREYFDLLERDYPEIRLYYTHRSNPIGYKGGNIRHFTRLWHDRADYFVVLDSDSLMSGEQIIRFIRLMETNPKIGILQSMTVALPGKSLFNQIFRFGLRQRMRLYTLGNAWWQGPEGEYWGHNAVVRMKPFYENCRLPVLSGGPPWGGFILSHDQIEALLMMRAGYEVRIVPQECDSYEEYPESLSELIIRGTRWAQGSLQCLRLLGLPQLSPLHRLQVLLCSWIYATSLFWYLFLVLIIGQHFFADLRLFHGTEGIMLLLIVLLINVFPKILGYADIMLQSKKIRGGRRRMIKSIAVEVVSSHIVAGIVGLSLSSFILGMIAGKKRVIWKGGMRGTAMSFKDTVAFFLPHTLFGTGLSVIFLIFEPYVLLWISPIVIGLVLSIPFAWESSQQHSLTRLDLFETPETLYPSELIKVLRPSRATASRKSS